MTTHKFIPIGGNRRRGTDGVRYEEVLIHLRRQTHYADKPGAYQADVRRAPITVRSGAFEIEVEGTIADFQREVTANLAMEADEYYRTDPRRESAEAQRARYEQTLREVERLGRQFLTLLPHALSADLQQLAQWAIEKGRGIYLIMEAEVSDPAMDLLRLPWELLFAPHEVGSGGLAERLVVVRRLLGNVRHAPLMLNPTPRLLHVVAIDDHDPFASALRELAAVEQTVIPETLGKGGYVALAPSATFSQTTTILNQVPPYELLHFLGHGTAFDPLPPEAQDETIAEARAFLRFVREDGTADPISGAVLRPYLKGVQVVVLNACHVAGMAGESVAMSLAASGTPYVVGMQGKLHPRAAAEFCRAFYGALQAGAPVELAVAAGRARLVRELPGAVDWCLPVIYTAPGVEPLAVVEGFGDWWWFQAGTTGKVFFPALHAIGAGLLLWLGLLLSVSGIEVAVPPVASMLLWMGWWGLVPIGIGVWVYQRDLKRIADRVQMSRRVMVERSLVSAFIGFGTAGYLGWAGWLVLVGVGLWEQLSFIGQGMALLPMLVACILLAYSQARGHGAALADNARVQQPRPDPLFVVVAAVAMALMLYGPLVLLLWYIPQWGIPLAPIGFYAMGLFWAVMAVALMRQSD